jgi:formyl-CoA transferase
MIWGDTVMNGNNIQPEALKGVRVLDLTRVVAGPYGGSILGDFGADVIKIEVPGKGDDARGYGPYRNGESMYYANLNRNKRGITLNLKTDEGKKIFKDLVKKSDVVLENYRPGVMDKLGLGYDVLKEINPRIIYAACSGFGCYGSYSQRPGYDIISQGMGGLMSITGATGGEPTRSGNAMGDILGGMNMVMGVLLALFAREKTGVGQRVDVSLVDSVVASLENAYIRFFDSGNIPVRSGNAYASIAPYDTYHAKDGFVIIACGNQKLYEKFCKLIDREDMITDERFLTVPLRVKNNLEQKKEIEKWTLTKDVSEVVDIVLGAGIPAGPIYDVRQITRDHHIAVEREMFIDIDHPVIGPMKVNGNPIKLMDMMPRINRPAPTLGQDNEDILKNLLDYSDSEINVLKSKSVI